jgi:hypothetical protein
MSMVLGLMGIPCDGCVQRKLLKRNIRTGRMLGFGNVFRNNGSYMTDLRDMIFSYSEELEVPRYLALLSTYHIRKHIRSCNATYSSLLIVFPP